MSLFGSTVLTKYKADASDQLAAVKNIAIEEKRLADTRARQLDQHDKGVTSLVEKLGQWNQAIELGMKAGKFAFDAMEMSARRAQLTAKAGKIDIDALAVAAGGLQTRMELLDFAARTQTASMKLSQSQLEMVQRAMRALTNEGKDHEEVTRRVTEAVVKLEGEGLKDFGIRVREATGDADKFNAILEALEAKSRGVKDGQDQAGEGVLRAKVAFKDAQDNLIDGVGKLATSMTPLLESLAQAVGLVGQIAGFAASLASAKIPGTDSGFLSSAISVAGKVMPGYGQAKWAYKNLFTDDSDWGGIETDQVVPNFALSATGVDDHAGALAPRISLIDKWNNYRPGVTDAEMGIAAQLLRNAANPAEFEESQKAAREAAERALGAIEDNYAKMEEFAKSPEGRRAQARALFGALGVGIEGRNVGAIGAPRLGPSELGAAFTGEDAFGVTRTVEGARAAEDELFRRLIGDTDRIRTNEAWNRRLQGYRDRGKDLGAGSGIRAYQKSQLEQMFGPLEQFNAYKMAFDALAGSVSAAMNAWIDGSKSAGEAARAFVGDFVQSLSVQLAVEAIKHGAYAIASIIPGPFFNPAGAAGHAKAAAAFAAGSAVAAAAARGLHGGGGAAPSSGGGGGAGGGSPIIGGGNQGGLPGGGQPQIIVIGNTWARETPRAQALEAQELFGMATGLSSGGSF